MPLTDSQKIDAIYRKFVLGDTTVGRTGLDAPAPGPGVTPTPPPMPHADWWDASATDDAAFCADLKLDPRQIVPWVQDARGNINKATDGTNLVSFPTLLALDPADPNIIAKAKAYAAHGYGADGVQRLQTAIGFTQARTAALRVYNCNTPADAENVLKGASNADADTVAYYLMTTPNVFAVPGMAHFGGGLTIPDQIATQYRQSTRKPGDPGPSGI